MPPKNPEQENLEDLTEVEAANVLVALAAPSVAQLPAAAITEDPLDMDHDLQDQDEVGGPDLLGDMPRHDGEIGDWPDWVVARLRREEQGDPTERGVQVDLETQPHGRGRWYWRDNAVDRPLAAALGVRDARQLVRLREWSRFPAGTRLPRTIYIPEAEYFNPIDRPGGGGRWEFFHDDDFDLAQVNVQGQLYFPMNYIPTAHDIFSLRQHYRAEQAYGYEVGVDLTDNINIVWVPDHVQTGEDVERDSTAHPPDRSKTAVHLPDVHVDQRTGLIHEPRNKANDGHDQFGIIGGHHWQTRLIDGKKYTVDRSTAKVNREEKDQHKLWAVNKDGNWVPYNKLNELGWSDKKSVKHLNDWREQAFQRGKWPPKRDRRPDYNEEEYEWLWENYVVPHSGANPPDNMRTVTERFAQQFPNRPSREVAGITAVLGRLRTEYNENGGQRKERHPRGWKPPSQPEDPAEPEDREEDDHEEEEAAEDKEE